MITRIPSTLLAISIFLLAGPNRPAFAQPKEQFVEALAELTTAVDGRFGDEGPRITDALDAMGRALAAWSASVAAVESRFAQEVSNASPGERAKLHASLGVVYLDRGRYVDGLRELEASIRVDPTNADVHAMRARALIRNGSSSEAASAAEAAWRLRPRDISLALLFLIANPTASSEATSQALEVVRAQRDRLLRAAAPGAPPFVTLSLVDDEAAPEPVLGPASYTEAWRLLAGGQYEAALTELRAAAAADPIITAPAPRAASDALRNGDMASAVRLLTDAAANGKQSSEIERLLGVAHMAAGERDGAIPHFEAAIRLSPADDRSRLALVEAIAASGDVERVEATLREAVTVQPLSGPCHLRLAKLYLEQQREADALGWFEAAARMAPVAGVARLWVTIGRLRENQLDAEGTLTALSRASAIAPNHVPAHRERAEVLLAMGRLAAAEASYLVAVSIDPLDAESWVGVADLEAAQGQHAGALAILDRAIELNPRHLQAHYARSQALFRLDRSDEANAALEIFRGLQAAALEEKRRAYERSLREIEVELQKTPQGVR